ncbi:MAG: hypothetical protein NC924_05415 [Candidatus Omnitrophica bacterium]|nr:hypothetical protein [Candidatus Omnitrophota bacterium]
MRRINGRMIRCVMMTVLLAAGPGAAFYEEGVQDPVVCEQEVAAERQAIQARAARQLKEKARERAVLIEKNEQARALLERLQAQGSAKSRGGRAAPAGVAAPADSAADKTMRVFWLLIALCLTGIGAVLISLRWNTPAARR